MNRLICTLKNKLDIAVKYIFFVYLPMKRTFDSDDESDHSTHSDVTESEEEEDDNLIGFDTRREKWLHDELRDEHGVELDLLNETDLKENKYICDKNTPIGEPGPVQCKGITSGSTVTLCQLSYHDIDMYTVAKKGALFGLSYTEDERICFVDVRCNIRCSLFKSGALVISDSHQSSGIEKVITHLLALLRYVCGLSDLVIVERSVKNMTTTASLILTQKIDSVRLLESMEATLEGVAIVLPLSLIGLYPESIAIEDENRIIFLIYPAARRVICVGGKSVDTIIAAHRALIGCLSRFVCTPSRKKCRTQ